MTSDKRVQTVDCAYTRLNKLVGIVARNGVYRLTVDVEFHFGDNGCAAVARSAHAVENSAQHIFAHAEFDAVAEESRLRSCHFYALRRLEKLHESFVAVDFKHFAASDFAVFLSYLDKFVIFDALNALNEHKRADNFSYGVVFF